jgi:hypothetical protein
MAISVVSEKTNRCKLFLSSAPALPKSARPSGIGGLMTREIPGTTPRARWRVWKGGTTMRLDAAKA